MSERVSVTICREFDSEVEVRLSEAHLIQQRIKDSRELLRRLRFAVLANYYNEVSLLENTISACADSGDEDTALPMSRLLAERQWETSSLLQQSDLSANFSEMTTPLLYENQFTLSPPGSPSDSLLLNMESNQGSVSSLNASPVTSSAVTPVLGSPCVNHIIDEVSLDAESILPVDVTMTRFYVTKRIIIGNTSQYLLSTSKSDPTTHKWMVYVRGPPEEEEINQFISSVWFFLHPSYAPNDIVKVTQTPFHLIRRGWGEFPVRVQLHFSNPNQKPVDVIHNLKLDKTKTGRQTLGAETVVDIELEKSSVKGNDRTEMKVTSIIENHLFNHTLKSYIGKDSSVSICECKQVDSATGTTASMLIGRSDENIEAEKLVDSESDLVTTKSTKTGAVYHIDIPTVDPDEIVMLDHCYDHCVVVSHKPHKIMDQLPGNAVEQCMHKLVRLLPLVGEKCSLTPFTASSVEEFYKWQIGKQRAAEWTRARSLRDLVADHLSAGYAIPKTRDIVYWCRKNGYAPLNVSVSHLCIVCGYSTFADEQPYHLKCGENLFRNDYVTFNSTSTPFNLYEDLTMEEKKLTNKEHTVNSDDMEVDVVNLPQANMSQTCHNNTFRHTSKSRLLPANCQPSSGALRWVNQEASKVDLTLQPILMDGILAHAPTHMLYSATQKFLTQLIQQALMESEEQNKTAALSTADRNMTPTQVFTAIKNIREFDFLTNQYFGLLTDNCNN